jgi:hypothetical protein
MMLSVRANESSFSSIYGLSPPHGVITQQDHGGFIVILAWISMCFFTLSVITRIVTRFLPVRVYGTDDVVIVLSAVGEEATATLNFAR